MTKTVKTCSIHQNSYFFSCHKEIPCKSRKSHSNPSGSGQPEFLREGVGNFFEGAKVCIMMIPKSFDPKNVAHSRLPRNGRSTGGVRQNPLTYGLFIKMIFCDFNFFELFDFFEKSEVKIFLVPIEYEIMEAGLGNSFFSEKKYVVGSRKKTRSLEVQKR